MSNSYLEITRKKGLLRPPQLEGILPFSQCSGHHKSIIDFLLSVVASMSVRLGNGKERQVLFSLPQIPEIFAQHPWDDWIRILFSLIA